MQNTLKIWVLNPSLFSLLCFFFETMLLENLSLVVKGIDAKNRNHGPVAWFHHQAIIVVFQF